MPGQPALRTVTIPGSRRPSSPTAAERASLAARRVRPDLPPEQRSRWSTILLVLCDLIAVAAMTAVAEWRTAGLIAVVAAPVWLGAGLYRRRLTPTIFKDAVPLAIGAVMGVAVAAVVRSPGPWAFFQALTTLFVVSLLSRGRPTRG